MAGHIIMENNQTTVKIHQGHVLNNNIITETLL